MKRRYSLKRNKEFRYLYKVGKSQRCRTLVLIYSPARHGSIRFGFCVSKRIGNAVVRNYTKRRMREAVKSCFDDIRLGYNMIFIARDPIKKVSFAKLQSDVRSLLEKAQLINQAIPLNTTAGRDKE